MKRRDFLKSVSGLAAGAMVPAPAIWSPARADARSETLLVVTETHAPIGKLDAEIATSLAVILVLAVSV